MGDAPTVPTPRPRWRYLSETFFGNWHRAAEILTEEHPDWDVVALGSTGQYTVVVYRELLTGGDGEQPV